MVFVVFLLSMQY